MAVAYHIRLAPLTLSRLDLLVVALVQSLFPGVKTNDVVFPKDSLDKHRIKTLETLQRRTNFEGVNSLRAAQNLEPMTQEEHRTWLDQQSLELAITSHKTGVTGLTFKLMGPACDNAPGQPINAGYENVHEFTLISFLTIATKKVTLLAEPADVKTLDFSGLDIPFSPLPLLHFRYDMPKNKKGLLTFDEVDQKCTEYLNSTIEEKIKTVPGFENVKYVSFNADAIMAPLSEFVANLRHWLPVEDAPINFELQSALVPLDKNVWKVIFVVSFQIDANYLVPLTAQKLSLSEDDITAYLTNYYE